MDYNKSYDKKCKNEKSIPFLVGNRPENYFVVLSSVALRFLCES